MVLLQAELESTSKDLSKASKEVETLRVQLSSAVGESKQLKADLAKLTEEAAVFERKLAAEVLARAFPFANKRLWLWSLCVIKNWTLALHGQRLPYIRSLKRDCWFSVDCAFCVIGQWSVDRVVELQVANNRTMRAENTSLRNEVGTICSQLSAASKQLEAEQKTSTPQKL